MNTDTTPAPLITDAQLADLLAGYDHVPGAIVFARQVLPRLIDIRDAYEQRLAELDPVRVLHCVETSILLAVEHGDMERVRQLYQTLTDDEIMDVTQTLHTALLIGLDVRYARIGRQRTQKKP